MPDHDRIEGAAKNIGGKLKEAAGKLTGDEKLKAEGRADQVAGKGPERRRRREGRAQGRQGLIEFEVPGRRQDLAAAARLEDENLGVPLESSLAVSTATRRRDAVSVAAIASQPPSRWNQF